MGRLVVKRAKLLEKLRELGATQKTVVVGVLGAKGAEEHTDGHTVVEVAQWNHYGTSTIPARPFLAIAMGAHRDELRKLQRRLAVGLVQGKLELDQALGLLGEAATAAVKQTIAEGVPPANAPNTIARKGSATPLIDTGQLRGAVSYDVRARTGDMS